MTNESKGKKRFNTRGLTSFIAAWTFLVVLVTGCVLYAAPKGRVANWTGWAVLGLDKEEWGAVHMVTACAFITAVAFHLYFNWTVFLSYFKKKMQAGFNLRREFALATGLAVIIVGGTVLNAPPFSVIVKWNDDIKLFWEARSAPAPYPHAEESTLAEFAEKAGLDLEEAVARLKAGGFRVPDTDTRIGKLSKLNGVTPSALFAAMSKGKGNQSGGDAARSGQGASPGGGMGLGRMTLEQVCAEQGIALETAQAALAEKGIDAQPGDLLKSLAHKANASPKEVLAIISGAQD